MTDDLVKAAIDAERALLAKRTKQSRTLAPTPGSCPTCNSRHVLYRVRANEYWCRRCGRTWPKERPL